MRSAVMVLGLHALLILFTFRHYGLSWDQVSGHQYEQAVVRFYSSHGRYTYSQESINRFYGGLFELLSALTEKVTGLRWLEARDLTSALLGWVGTYAILRAGWIAFCPAVGVIAAAFLMLTPVYYGHEFINPKDAPFAALIMLALYYAVSLATEYPAPRWRTALKLGLAAGAAMGVRVGGLILFGPAGLGALLAVGFGWWLNGTRASFRPLLTLSLQLLLVLALAWTVMVAVWPFAWTDPLRAPLLAVVEFSKYPWPGNVFYDGKLLKPWDLPWTYVPNLVVRTMPEHILLGLLAGTIGLGFVRRIRLAEDRGAIIGTVVFLAAFIWPLGIIWDFDSNLYDGYRQVLFIIPPLVLLSAAGAWYFFQRVKSRGVRMAAGGVFGAALLLVAVDMVTLHPYEYIYFNRSVAGGLAEANKSYDLDYWATALTEAAQWVAKNFNPTPGKPVVYSMNDGEPLMAELPLAGPLASGAVFRRAEEGQKATLRFLIRRERQTTPPTEGRVIHVVARQGVPLVDVVELP